MLLASGAGGQPGLGSVLVLGNGWLDFERETDVSKRRDKRIWVMALVGMTCMAVRKAGWHIREIDATTTGSFSHYITLVRGRASGGKGRRLVVRVSDHPAPAKARWYMQILEESDANELEARLLRLNRTDEENGE